MITYDKTDETHAFIDYNGERIGWIENHKLRGCYKLVVLFESFWIPFGETKIKELIETVYKSKRFEKYSEQRLIDRGFTLKG